jgi:hypothetical protein
MFFAVGEEMKDKVNTNKNDLTNTEIEKCLLNFANRHGNK